MPILLENTLCRLPKVTLQNTTLWHSVEGHSLPTVGMWLAGSDVVLRTVSELIST